MSDDLLTKSPIARPPASVRPASIEPVQKLMDFPQAMDAVIDGERITKLEWHNTSTLGTLRDGILMLHKDNQWFQWIINAGDLLGKDWVTC